ncbi:MAG: transcription antitermination factor NusB [Bacteroidales bacterium]|nr:transcription antitermination factor NusB [Bacteroidales bacterium]
MLSRHFLRSKVLQAVYANQFGEKDPQTSEKEFDDNILKLNDLGVVQISMLLHGLAVAGQIVIDGSHKLLPDGQDYSDNTDLTDNPFLHRLADNYELHKLIDRCKINWEVHDGLFRKAFFTFRDIDAYKALNVEEHDFENTKSQVLQYFRFLVNDEGLRSAIAERSLLWDDDFDQVAQYNFMMLKTLSEDTFTEDSPWPLMCDNREEKDSADYQFAKQLLHDTLAGRAECEQLIKKHLQGWDYERVSPMDIIIINIAIAEFTTCPSIPERVTVDECIELSKEYSTDRSKLFINGILDRIIIELRAAGRINKSGRGLFDESLINQED